MISLLVVSDTHGQKYILEEVLKRQLQIDDKFRPRHLVHLGDGIEDLEGSAYCDRMCIHSVRGNCDSIFYSMSNAVPKEKVIEIMGYRIAFCHGNLYGVKDGDENAVAWAAEQNADLLMFGHTHIACSYTVKSGTLVKDTILEKDLAVFNPGSLRYCGSFGVVTFFENGFHTSIEKM